MTTFPAIPDWTVSDSLDINTYEPAPRLDLDVGAACTTRLDLDVGAPTLAEIARECEGTMARLDGAILRLRRAVAHLDQATGRASIAALGGRVAP